MADELAKKISELDNLPNGDMDGFYTIGSKDNAQGNPVSYKMNLVVLKNAIAAAAAAVANANDAVLAAQAAQAAFLDAIVQQTGQNTAKVMSQKAVTDALAAMSDTITTLTGRIGDIRDLIPSAASASNQLADKAFVNSSIATATAEFRGTYNSLAELQAVSADENDYGYVRTTDAAGNTVYKRYKYSGGSWTFEYDLNNSSFTAAQWAAINSAITAELVEKLRALPTNAALTELLNGKQGVIADLDTIRANAAAGGTAYQKPAGGIPASDMSAAVQTSLGKADSAVQDVSGKADKTELEAIAEEVAKKANTDGYYGGMTAGSAENLVGRGSVEAEIQGIRTSAGQEDIGTGAAIIREVRGKSLVWNQLTQKCELNTVLFPTAEVSKEGNYPVFTWNDATRSGRLFLYAKTGMDLADIRIGHKYFVGIDIHKLSGMTLASSIMYISLFGNTVDLCQSDLFVQGANIAKIILAERNTYDSVSIYQPSNNTLTIEAGAQLSFWVNCIDLTLMFGAGNEPSTVDEFERMFTLPYYEHNGGTIVNNEATGLRTRGFNLYNPVTGKAVLPGKYSDYPYEYEICGAFTSISFEDYAGNVSVPELTDGRFFNVPSPGVLTVVGGNATDTCVHLVWSGWRNYGQPDYIYEPYWENTLQLNLKTITGKCNGEGESVVIFPNGMCGVGTAYDRLIVDPDGFARQGQVKMVELDLASLNWSLRNRGNQKKVYSASLPYAYRSFPVSSSYLFANCISLGISIAGGTSLAYINKVGVDNMNDGLYFFTKAAGRDVTVYAIVPLSSEGISGTLLYEIATPREYVLDEPIPLTYMVDDFGSEAKIPVDTAELPTGPLRFAVTYPFNAVDKLRRQRKEMIPADNFDQFLVLLGQAYGGTWNRTYDATTDDQKFTYTPPESEPTGTNDNNE